MDWIMMDLGRNIKGDIPIERKVILTKYFYKFLRLWKEAYILQNKPPFAKGIFYNCFFNPGLLIQLLNIISGAM